MHAPDINCPYCGSEMTAGTAYVGGTIFGFLMFGFSYEHFWFSSGGEKKVIVRSGEQRAGHRCNDCGAVAVYPLTRKWSE